MTKCYKCDKHANYGVPNAPLRISCKAHILPEFVYKPGANRKCHCGRNASFGSPEDRIRRTCAKHKSKDHIILNITRVNKVIHPLEIIEASKILANLKYHINMI
jgi:hypothetical protein